MNNLFSSVSNYVRRNPGRSAGIAAGVGALAGLAYYGYRQYRRRQMGPVGPRNAITPNMLQQARANLNRADYGVASANHDTIHVRRNAGQTPTQFVDFMRQSRTAVATIDSQPVGHRMLQGIQGGANPDLDLASNQLVQTNLHIREAAANTTRYLHPGAAVNSPAYRQGGVDGAGNVPSRINWNPGITRVNGARRPAFIGLGHEMVHAWRAQTGTAVLRDNFQNTPIRNTPVGGAVRRLVGSVLHNRDELETVGLLATPRHANAPSENALRREHNLIARQSYSGITAQTYRNQIGRLGGMGVNQRRALVGTLHPRIR